MMSGTYKAFNVKQRSAMQQEIQRLRAALEAAPSPSGPYYAEYSRWYNGPRKRAEAYLKEQE